MSVWTHAVLSVLYACFVNKFHLERRSRNALIIIIIIIIII